MAEGKNTGDIRLDSRLRHKAAARTLSILSSASDPAVWPLFVLLAIMGVRFFILYGWNHLAFPNADLPSFYAASIQVFRHGASPYDFQKLAGLMQEQVYPFLYPPPSLLLYSPMALFSYAHVRVAVLLLNHLSVALVLWLIPFRLMKLELRRDAAMLALLFVYVLTFNPIVETGQHGQVNLLLLLLLLGF